MTLAFGIDLATDYGIVLVMALGLHVMMLCGQVSLGHGGMVGIGAYAGAVATANLGLPYVAGLLLSTVAGAAAGLLIANLLAVRISGLYLAIGTFAIGQALITAWINIDYVGGGIGFTQIPMLTKWPAVFVAVPIVIFAIHRLELSRFGHGFRAVAADEILAAAMGTDVKRMKVMAWTMGCAITALGGGLHAHRVSVITPAEFGFLLSLQILLAPILGGTRSYHGAMVGAFVVWATPWALYGFEPELRLLMFGALFVIMMVYRPQGLLGTTRG